MKQYMYHEPGEDDTPLTVVMTEEQIICGFWEYYCGCMAKVNKCHLISYANALDNWRVVHWATEIE